MFWLNFLRSLFVRLRIFERKVLDSLRFHDLLYVDFAVAQIRYDILEFELMLTSHLSRLTLLH